MHWLCLFEFIWAVVLKGWGSGRLPNGEEYFITVIVYLDPENKKQMTFHKFYCFKFSTNNVPLIACTNGDCFHSLLLECSAYMTPHTGMVFDFYNDLSVDPKNTPTWK